MSLLELRDITKSFGAIHALQGVDLTVSEGDVSLYRALTGSRHAMYSSAEFSKANGKERLAIDPWFAFVFLEDAGEYLGAVQTDSEWRIENVLAERGDRGDRGIGRQFRGQPGRRRRA